MKLGLSDVLLDVNNGTIYTPNTNQTTKLDGKQLQSKVDGGIIETEERYDHNPKRDKKGRFTFKGVNITSLQAKVPKKERARVSSQIFTDFPNLKADGKAYHYENRNHFYVFSVNSPGSYSFHIRLKLEGNQALINYVTEMLKK